MIKVSSRTIVITLLITGFVHSGARRKWPFVLDDISKRIWLEAIFIVQIKFNMA